MYDERHNARGDEYETSWEEASEERRLPNRHERRKKEAIARRLRNRFEWKSPKDDEDNFN